MQNESMTLPGSWTIPARHLGRYLLRFLGQVVQRGPQMHAAPGAHAAGLSSEWSGWNGPWGGYRFVTTVDRLLIGWDRSAPRMQCDIRDLDQPRLHRDSGVTH